MDKNKNNHIWAMIGILLLIVAILALFRYRHSQLEAQRIIIEERVSRTSKNKQLTAAEEAVKALEQDMTDENVTKAQHAVDYLKESDIKIKLQKRINVVKERLAKKMEDDKLKSQAEETVNHLEQNKSSENLILAQEAVDKLTDTELQATLQVRINKVKGELEAHPQESTNSDAVTEIPIPQENQNSSDNSAETPPVENVDNQGLETGGIDSPQIVPDSGDTDSSIGEPASPTSGDTGN
ncbi:hypothetical protein AB6M97_03410 [Streptococcus hillyeri]|uniref:Uncharacterized protein n=1 Tax=Streptococcus hillyeri TaxID=2282420 RepID=A0A3L9DPC6_9STRE|nr:hypothetical protein [Streptococcus hillyeri]RLY01793.1 hypothetical protein EAF07_08955 [Streptococcus hillyeri]